MIQGWLVYNQEDLKKNKFFAESLVRHGENLGLQMKLMVREEIVLGVNEEGLTMWCNESTSLPTFVVNRTRDSFFAKHLELLGIRVFNSFQVTDLCNDKGKTHQFVNHLGIPSVDTVFWDQAYQTIEQMPLAYPVVVKTVDGHGGEEVCKVASKETLETWMVEKKRRHYVIQSLCSQVGVDVRVFVVGDVIQAAIKRESVVDFRSNYSLGGKTSLYEVDEVLQGLVARIVKHLPCDCVGIDFMVDKDGNYIFNEIEDVVGSRSLYANSTIDLAERYMMHIQKRLS